MTLHEFQKACETYTSLYCLFEITTAKDSCGLRASSANTTGILEKTADCGHSGLQATKAVFL